MDVYGCIAKDKSGYLLKGYTKESCQGRRETLNTMQDAYKLVIKMQLMELHFLYVFSSVLLISSINPRLLR